MPSQSLRHQVLRVYKELLFLGREYPQGYTWFRDKLHNAFYNRRNLTDEEEIRKGIDKAEYLKKELEKLYHVRKYRFLKKSYEGFQ